MYLTDFNIKIQFELFKYIKTVSGKLKDKKLCHYVYGHFGPVAHALAHVRNARPLSPAAEPAWPSWRRRLSTAPRPQRGPGLGIRLSIIARLGQKKPEPRRDKS